MVTSVVSSDAMFCNKVSSCVTWLTSSDHSRQAGGLGEQVVVSVLVVDVCDLEALQGWGVGVRLRGREVIPGGRFGRTLILRFV